MLGGTYLLTKLVLPSLERAAEEAEREGREAGAHVINVSSGGMYTVSAAGVAADLNSLSVEPYDGTLM